MMLLNPWGTSKWTIWPLIKYAYMWMVHRATQANGASEETSGFILVSMRAAWNAWVTKWDFQAIWQNDRAKSAVILARRHIGFEGSDALQWCWRCCRCRRCRGSAGCGWRSIHRQNGILFLLQKLIPSPCIPPLSGGADLFPGFGSKSIAPSCVQGKREAGIDLEGEAEGLALAGQCLAEGQALGCQGGTVPAHGVSSSHFHYFFWRKEKGMGSFPNSMSLLSLFCQLWISALQFVAPSQIQTGQSYDRSCVASLFWGISSPISIFWGLPEMEKRADTADISVLFFLDCANFLAVYAQTN